MVSAGVCRRIGWIIIHQTPPPPPPPAPSCRFEPAPGCNFKPPPPPPPPPHLEKWLSESEKRQTGMNLGLAAIQLIGLTAINNAGVVVGGKLKIVGAVLAASVIFGPEENMNPFSNP